MRFNPPTKITFWITIVLAALAFLAVLVTIPVLSSISFWLLLVAYVILAVSLFVKGM
jgi:hypothetical protein